MPSEHSHGTTPHGSLFHQRFMRSNMGLIHVTRDGKRAVCGISLRSSWEPVEVADWASEPNVCRLCDDVVMLRGRKAAGA